MIRGGLEERFDIAGQRSILGLHILSDTLRIVHRNAILALDKHFGLNINNIICALFCFCRKDGPFESQGFKLRGLKCLICSGVSHKVDEKLRLFDFSDCAALVERSVFGKNRLKIRGRGTSGRVGHKQGKVGPRGRVVVSMIAHVLFDHDDEPLARPYVIDIDRKDVTRVLRLEGARVIGVHKVLPSACRVLFGYVSHTELDSSFPAVRDVFFFQSSSSPAGCNMGEGRGIAVAGLVVGIVGDNKMWLP